MNNSALCKIKADRESLDDGMTDITLCHSGCNTYKPFSDYKDEDSEVEEDEIMDDDSKQASDNELDHGNRN